MKVAVFAAKPYEKLFLEKINQQHGHELEFFSPNLDFQTVTLATGFERLLTFPNVIITGHQAFFTEDALNNIAETTLSNITAIAQNKPCPNQITG